jgi:hypothetical protein
MLEWNEQTIERKQSKKTNIPSNIISKLPANYLARVDLTTSMLSSRDETTRPRHDGQVWMFFFNLKNRYKSKNIKILLQTERRYVHAYIGMYIQMNICMYIQMNICMYIQMKICMYIHIHMYVHSYTYICTFIYKSMCSHICTYVCIFIYICMYIHICTYVCTFIYVHMYVHSFMYICMYIHRYVHSYVHLYVPIFPLYVKFLPMCHEKRSENASKRWQSCMINRSHFFPTKTCLHTYICIPTYQFPRSWSFSKNIYFSFSHLKYTKITMRNKSRTTALQWTKA